MPLLSFLLRLLLVAAGLVFAASVAFLAVVLLALWALRAGWARLTGRPVTPFVVRMGPGRAFDDFVRRAGPQASRTPRADAAGDPRARLGDVSDVEPRPPR
jgi:hypothetical protein